MISDSNMNHKSSYKDVSANISKQNTQASYFQGIKDLKGHVIKNTIGDWNRLASSSTKDLLDKVNTKHDGTKELCIFVANPILTEKNDLWNLAYFFPIVDRINRIAKGVKKVLILDISDQKVPSSTDLQHDLRKPKSSESYESFIPKNSIYWRLMPFLLAQAFETDIEIKFYYELPHNGWRLDKLNKSTSSLKDLHDIQPLLSVSAYGEKGVRYQDLHLFPKMEITENRIEINEPRDPDIFVQTNRLSTTDLIGSIFNHQIEKAFKGISGNDQFQLKTEEKEKHIKAICSFLKIKLIKFDYLSCYIWSTLFSQLMEQKEIVVPQSDSSQNSYIDFVSLDKSLTDAVTYSEILYQILENSCLHSSQKKGYFSFRYSQADRNVTINELPKIADNLRRLNQQFRYKKKKTSALKKTEKLWNTYSFEDKEYRWYLTLFELDDAVYEGSLYGMLDKYNESVLQRDEFIRTDQLGELFFGNSISERKDADDCIEHYGLELFGKTVVVNDGFMLLSSPYKMGEKQYLSVLASDSNKPFSENYEIDQTDNGILEEEQFINSFTEYKVVLPVGYRESKKATTIDKLDKSLFLFENNCLASGVDGYYSLGISESPSASESFWQYEEYSSVDEKKIQIEKLCGYLLKSIIQADLHINSGARVEQLDAEEAQHLQDKKNNYRICALNAKNIKKNRIEVFSKAIFKLSYYLHNPEASHIEALNLEVLPIEQTRLAILFHSEVELQEFVRYFSIFCGPYGTEEVLSEKVLPKIQIALCLEDESEIDKSLRNPMICFLLAGESIECVRMSAEVFAYYNPRTSRRFLPLVAYLTRTINTVKSVSRALNYPEEFPFDLFLDKTCFMEPFGVKKTVFPFFRDKESKNSLFLDYLHESISTSLVKSTEESNRNTSSTAIEKWKNTSQGQLIGCKIPNTHVQLKSGIHLDTFYEAELVYKNIGISYRMAYLVAAEIIRKIKDIRSRKSKLSRIIILGYEEYAQIFLQELNRLLYRYSTEKENDDGLVEVSSFVYPEEIKRIQDYCKKRKITRDFYGETLICLIEPIGTTLSTLYEMLNTTTLQIENIDSEYILGFAPLVVQGTSIQSGEETKRCAAAENYWESMDSNTCSVHLTKYSANGASIIADYYLMEPAIWYLPENCSLCSGTAPESANTLSKERALLFGNRASTVPNAVYTERALMEKDTENTIRLEKTSISRIMQLYGYVTYGHTCREDNHFLYWLDFKGMMDCLLQPTMLSDFDQCLKNWRSSIGAEAFNIIISPQHASQSGFVKTVIDRVFDHSIHYISVDFSEIVRDDFKIKFDGVMEDYRTLLALNPNTDFHVYYVDDCIVTGRSIDRAKVLINSLLRDGLQKEFLNFEKIILLVNRSSTDTLASYVNYPQSDVLSYIRLRVPSYNTSNGICPFCKEEEKYRRLAKQSSTNELANEYKRLADKSKKFSADEKYNQKYDKRIAEESMFFNMLLRSLFSNPERFNEGIKLKKQVLNALTKKYVVWEKRLKTSIIPKNDEQMIIEDLEGFQDELRHLTINKLFDADADANAEDLKKYCVNAIKESCLNPRSYLRMYCVHRATSYLINGYGYILSENNSQKTIVTTAKNKDAELCETFEETIKKILSLITTDVKQLIDKQKTFATKKKRTDTKNLLVNYSEIEVIESYIKILTRKQLASYAHIRNAMLNILTMILEDILTYYGLPNYSIEERRSTSQTWEISQLLLSKNGRVLPSAEQRITLTILRRLVELQSNFLCREGVLDSVINQWEVLRRAHYENCLKGTYIRDDYRIERPDKAKLWFSRYDSKKDLVFSIVKLLKWLSVSEEGRLRNLPLERFLNNMEMVLIEPSQPDVRTDIKRQIMQGFYLENIYTLEEGLEMLRADLDASREDQESDTKNLPTIDEAKNLVKSSREECKEIHDARITWMLHNNKTEFFKFTDRLPDSTIAHMLRFHYVIRLLEGLDTSDRDYKRDAFYGYCTVCDSMRDIMNAQSCWIIDESRSGISILAKSSIEVKTDVEDITENVAATNIEMLKNVHRVYTSIRNKNEKSAHLTDSSNWEVFGHPEKVVVFKHTDINNEQYAVIPIALQGRSDDTFYLVFKLKDLLLENGLREFRNVMFSRERLSELVSRDYLLLLNQRFSYDHIRHRSDKDKTVILHISDIHANPTNIDAITGMSKDAFESLEPKIEPDLLVITGDIISGASNAKRAEENYDAAKTIIREIVLDVFSSFINGKRYLIQDWNKRIVIIPGNHDYASMNELEGMQRFRKLIAGYPSTQNVSTMAKYAYYLDFMRDLLDVDISMLLANKMNEARTYPHLGVNILALNSNAQTSALRTNKIGFMEIKDLEKILDKSIQEKNDTGRMQRNILLMHHSLFYMPNYVLDLYRDAAPSCSCDKEFEAYICAYTDLIYTIEKEKLQAIINSGDTDIEGIIRKSEEKIISAYDSLKKSYERAFRSAKEGEFERLIDPIKKEIDYYLEFCKSMSDERVIELEKRIFGSYQAQNEDFREYQTDVGRIHEIMISNGEKRGCYELSGHTHQARRYLEEEIKCFEADKLYHKESGKKDRSNQALYKEQLNYQVLTIATTPSEDSYRYYRFAYDEIEDASEIPSTKKGQAHDRDTCSCAICSGNASEDLRDYRPRDMIKKSNGYYIDKASSPVKVVTPETVQKAHSKVEKEKSDQTSLDI